MGFGLSVPAALTRRSRPTAGGQRALALTEEDGLPHTCAANFDNLQTLPKSQIGDRITRLSRHRMQDAAAAVSFALALEED